jgi:hypothetical protein
MTKDAIVPGSIRVVVREDTYVTVRCGRCGAEFPARVEFRTARCKNCGRVCRLDQVAEAALNVTPIGRNGSAAEALVTAPARADRERLLERLAEADERALDRLAGLDCLMRQPGSLPEAPEPVPLHREVTASPTRSP